MPLRIKLSIAFGRVLIFFSLFFSSLQFDQYGYSFYFQPRWYSGWEPDADFMLTGL
jgi:hypothetical protein